MKSKNQLVELPLFVEKQVTLVLKREDLLHPFISGNKYRKLKYNIVDAKENRHTTILTFGGAFSNHIAATAYAAKENGLHSIGIIRGEELQNFLMENETLQKANNDGMRFKFISRSHYRRKEEVEFLEDLKKEFGDFYLIPEGGTNDLAIKGCEEIITDLDKQFDIVCSSVGTGGTVSGLINSSFEHQKILGFSSLKGDFLKKEIEGFSNNSRWNLILDYHFGGYAKITSELVQFINYFKKQTNIPLDPIYTGKMIFGLYDMVQRNTFAPRTKILAIHTGGLQGIPGMNSVLKKKKLPLLDI
ncbi:1-aminocyclopropane-1-carboxylate deaminase/D-cysteine desulfhydrase [Maribacter hydrothermalis]|uniref:1-aminocyclopropane-1-carboxylate deaminase n=1 Tax=Maribacter hydrothermalis TaxID=1836467 RepID=A0A1B7Z9L1_9FLAO|nr:pyridoxal-phosphate dependent enzyme [Maribacter hydrothermalis]APQ16701.1 1-aminocyclopropane-1-carboxylate deaminase [Maribacter hydrothermalis]OBR39382.1 1-aminocyclopropane-1-carboxylate deaminase [Maribacter hydrothermalis]